MANEVTPPVEAPATPVIPPVEPAPISTPAKPAEPSTETPPAVVKTEGESTKVEPAVEKPPEKPAVPEKYELKLKEGSLLDAKVVEHVEARAKALGLSAEQAQALLEEKEQTVSSIVQSQKDTLAANTAKWIEDVKNDKELGGEGVNENLETAKRFVAKFGSDAFKKELEITGYGNHPELIRIFARAGKALKDDISVFSGSKGGPDVRPLEDVFYGGTKTK